ncbi:MAG: mechanosensitive ion channel family protein [Deltaproteobacteria bacterium]|nr:mechanosensitive ion channel family protein [Deltaproteobacteria bacterium]
MANEIEKVKEIADMMTVHGRDIIIALALVVVGLIVVKWTNQALKKGLSKLPLTPARASVIRNIICVIILAVVAIMASIEIGLPARPVLQILTIITLTAVGVIAVFRPLIPTLPFKVGNTIKAGDLLGKVEATTVLNARLRTFDGKTVFVPNRKILNDDVINYHFTPTRRFAIKVNIKFDQDLMKAKQVIESIMVEDPRVRVTPRPVVYLMSLEKGYMELQGRGWTDNVKAFVVTRELLEKTKLRFDQEEFALAVPQLQVHYSKENTEHPFKEI